MGGLTQEVGLAQKQPVEEFVQSLQGLLEVTHPRPLQQVPCVGPPVDVVVQDRSTFPQVEGVSHSPLLLQMSEAEQHWAVGEHAPPVATHGFICLQVPLVCPPGMTHSVPAQHSPGAPVQPVPPSGMQPGPQTPCWLHSLEQHSLAPAQEVPSYLQGGGKLQRPVVASQ